MTFEEFKSVKVGYKLRYVGSAGYINSGDILTVTHVESYASGFRYMTFKGLGDFRYSNIANFEVVHPPIEELEKLVI